MALKENTFLLQELLEIANNLPEIEDIPEVQINLQEKIATPSNVEVVIEADEGYDGMSKVTIQGDSDLIAENIVKGKEIFGVQGNYENKGIDTSDANATAEDILQGASAYVNNQKIEGSIPKRNSDSLFVSGPTVVVHPGYYQSQTSKTVDLTEGGVPYFEAISSTLNSMTVVPKVINNSGYISGSMITGEEQTITAADLTSGILDIIENGKKDVTNYKEVNVNIPIPEPEMKLPDGFSAIAKGTYTLASAKAGGSTFDVQHNLGVIPDLFLFWTPTNIATTYSMLSVMRSSQFGWRSSTYLNKMFYHGNSTTTVTGADVTTSYGVKTLDSAKATITTYSNSNSYYWRAGTYNWLAIKFS